jgi:hypothetical protein
MKFDPLDLNSILAKHLIPLNNKKGCTDCTPYIIINLHYNRRTLKLQVTFRIVPAKSI